MSIYGKKYILAIIVATLLCPGAIPVKSFSVDEMALKDLDLQKSSFANGDVVSGIFTVENDSKTAADLDYEATLFQRKKVYGKEKFTINDQIPPAGSETQYFKYQLPKNIGSGEYILRIQLLSRSGYAFNWEEATLHIEGGGTYLSITDSYLLKDEERFDSAELPEYYNSEIPSAVLDVYNPHNETVTITPMISIRDTDGRLIDRGKVAGTERIIFPKRNEKIKLELLGAENVDTYFAEIELVKDDENISSIERFGWKVIKKEAKIVSVSTADGLFHPGKENELSVKIAGYSDENEIKKAVLSLEVRDTFGNLLQRKEKNIEIVSSETSEQIIVDVDTELPSLRIISVLSRNGKTVDSYDSIMSVKIERKAVKRETALPYFWIFFTGVLAIFGIIIAVNYSKIKKLLEK